MTSDALRTAFEAIRRDAFAPGPGACLCRRHGLTLAIGESVFVSDWPPQAPGLARSIKDLVNDPELRSRPVFWRVYDDDLPADLPAQLAEAGFQADAAGTLMGRALRDDLPASRASIDIIRVRDARQLAAFDRVIADAFSQDPVETNPARTEAWLSCADTLLFLGHAAGKLAGGGILDHVEGSAACHLRAGAVIPAFRGQGIYKTLVSARLSVATERGARFAFSDSNASSGPRLAAMGFRAVARETLWRLEPSDAILS